MQEQLEPPRETPALASSEELAQIADDAYVFGYPLVMMDLTKRAFTNVGAPAGFRAPVNQFARMEILPDATFRAVVRPNVDTLYTSAFLDLAAEPIVLHVPDTTGRFYLMPMLDAFTNVFASPGTRTTGSAANDFAIVGPDWTGTLPGSVIRIDAPTNLVWIIGRTQIDGMHDLAAVVELTEQYSLTPLSAFGKPAVHPISAPIDPDVDMTTPPPAIINAMTDVAFFERLATLLSEQEPPERDQAALCVFESMGLSPGRFAPSREALRALGGVGERVTALLRSHVTSLGTTVNGWTYATNLGSYGTRYLDRAATALYGLGANIAKDAVYPATIVDSNGELLTGECKYVVHFEKEPPVDAFWSLTLYGEDGYFAANPVDRYAIGDRDNLVRHPDASIDLLVQRSTPDVISNWLPAPRGRFNLLLRLYQPRQAVLDGSWKPPVVVRRATI